MTRAEQPTAVTPRPPTTPWPRTPASAPCEPCCASPQLKRLWSAQLVGGVGDALALLVLVLLALQAARRATGSFGGGYRGVALAVAAVFGARLLATLLFGAVLLGPLTALTAPGGAARPALDHGRRGRCCALALLVVAPLWIDWTPDDALACSWSPSSSPASPSASGPCAGRARRPRCCPRRPPEGAAGAPAAGPHGRAAPPVAAHGLRRAAARGRRAGRRHAHRQPAGHRASTGSTQHQAALGSYVAAGLFAASARPCCTFLELPDARTPRARSPLGGPAPAPKTRHRRRQGPYRRHPAAGARPAPRSPAAIAAAVAVAVLHANDLGGGPVDLRPAGARADRRHRSSASVRRPRVLPALSRRRLLALAIAFTGVALLAAGLVPDVDHRAADRAAGRHRRGRRRQHRARPARPGGRGVPRAPVRPSTCTRSYGSPSALGALVAPAAGRRSSARTGWRAASSSSRTAAPPSR